MFNIYIYIYIYIICILHYIICDSQKKGFKNILA